MTTRKAKATTTETTDAPSKQDLARAEKQKAIDAQKKREAAKPKG